MKFKAENDLLLSHELLKKENSFGESIYRHTLQATTQMHL